MQIQKANKEDLEKIITLNKLFHLDILGFKWDKPEWIETELTNYFIIKEDNQIYGAICLLLTEKECCVETIAVKENNQRSGIGRQLINFAKAYAKNKGKSKLKVESFCEYNADKFYENCGFVKEQEIGYYQSRPYHKFLINL